MNTAIILASGFGKRMNSNIPKQYLEINNKPIICHTIEKFENTKCINEIILVVNKDYIDFMEKEILSKYKYNKISKIIIGGRERQNSVYNGLLATNSETNIVIIHDGVRPFIKSEYIEKLVENTKIYSACVLGVKAIDTIKICNNDDIIENTPSREILWHAQTPQCFKYELILDAHKNAISKNFIGSDDSILVEKLGKNIKMIEGDYDNIKITVESDLYK